MGDSVLYDHYKDTVAEKNASANNRNRYFILTVVGTCVLCMYAYDPLLLSAAAQSWLSQYGIKASVSGSVLLSSLWVFVLYSFVRYLQAVVTVERLYLYLRKIESQLLDVCREGEDYDSLWNGLSQTIDFLYKRIFIVAMNAALIIKSVSEYPSFSIQVAFDWTCCIAIVVLSVLYWIFLKRVNELYSDDAL